MSEFKYYRPNSFPPLIKNLIIINVLVWIAQLMFQSYDLTSKLALYPVDTPFFNPYQIATHMFAHSDLTPRGGPDFSHIGFNMFSLWLFGRKLENSWGPKRFLFFYIISGIGAAACHLLIQHLRFDMGAIQDYNIALMSNNEALIAEARQNVDFLASVVGASGAIMGVMAAFAYLFPNTELYFPFIGLPIKAKWLVLGFAALDLFGGVGRANGDNVAHFAHLGGAITGFIIVYFWNKTNRKTFY
jgi:membrane associated rhomboid family serine protease